MKQMPECRICVEEVWNIAQHLTDPVGIFTWPEQTAKQTPGDSQQTEQ